MFAEKHFPESITHEELDAYLGRGWYRMGQMVFTCHFLFFEKNLYSPVWTRLPLQGYAFRKSLRKITRNVEKQFSVTIGPAELTEKKEMLFQKYSHNFDGNIGLSLKHNLQEEKETNIFDTYEVLVFHGKKLIALSFFDRGKISLTSILGIYDPAYHRHSLGLYTMLREIQYGLDNGYRYYYPGYIVPGNERFDYKLRIGKKEELEYFDLKTRGWLKYDTFSKENVPVDLLSNMLANMGHKLAAWQIACQIMYYPAYDAEIFGYENERLLESPLFLVLFNNIFPRPRFIIFYDLWKEKYIFSHCMTLEDLGYYFEHSMEYDHMGAKHFLDIILKKTKIIETKNMEEIVALAMQIDSLLKKPRQHMRRLK
ncbi:MAG TPA: arginine-tRNA-protein transferase [Bacteroidetes bacterium]|nr:arginine-tRNA-protein transferase [Bacteroidota bacterium]